MMISLGVQTDLFAYTCSFHALVYYCKCQSCLLTTADNANLSLNHPKNYANTIIEQTGSLLHLPTLVGCVYTSFSFLTIKVI